MNTYDVTVTIVAINECTVTYRVCTTCEQGGLNTPCAISAILTVRSLPNENLPIIIDVTEIIVIPNDCVILEYSFSGNGNYDLSVTYGGVLVRSDSFEITNCICIHPDMLIETKTGNKKIKDIFKDEEVLDINGKPIKVLFNIISGLTNEFYKIPKNSLGYNIPNDDFYIHGDHPFMYNGNETIAKNLIGNISGVELIYLNKSVNIYSLCTEERTMIKTLGDFYVCTYEEKEFLEYAKNTNLIYKIQ